MRYAKKITAILLAMLLCMALMPTAFAEQQGTLDFGTINITNAVVGQTYKVYQLAYLESYNTSANAYSYKANSQWKTWLQGQTTYVTVDGQDYVTWENTNENKDSDDNLVVAADFAKLALDKAKTLTADASITASSTTVTFSNLRPGYYLVDTTLGSFCALGTTTSNNTVTVKEKNGVPTVTKYVYEYNNNKKGQSTWNTDSNDASIGDDVEFRTVIHAKKGAQNYVLHDRMDPGFTLNKDSIKVYDIGAYNTATTSGYFSPQDLNNKTTLAASNYTINTTTKCEKCAFDIEFKQNYLNTITADKDILVAYKATLNSNAKLDGGDNINKTYLTYGDSLTVFTSTAASGSVQPGDPIAFFKDSEITNKSINTANVKSISVTASGIPTGKKVEIFYVTNPNVGGFTDFNEPQKITFSSSKGVYEQEFVFDDFNSLTKNETNYWTGTISKLRIDPFDAQTEAANDYLVGTSCSIKKISFNLNNGSSIVFDLRTEDKYKQYINTSQNKQLTASFDGAGSFESNVAQTITKTWTIPIYKFTKYGSERALEGATFNLLFESGTLRFSPIPADGVRGKVSDYIYNKDLETNADNQKIISPSNGYIYLKGLDGSQTYTLKEIKAPAGYNMLPADGIKFTVDHNGKITINSGGESGTLDSNNNTIKVENKTGSLLPKTGGIGAVIFYTVDGAVILAFLIAIIVRRRRKLRRVESGE